MQERNRPVYSISIVAHMLEVHPQTLRTYEREGLVSPGRTKGKTRLYSLEDLDRLRAILHLTQELGVNLAGVGLLLEFQARVHKLDSNISRNLEQLLDGGPLKKASPSGKKKAIKIKIQRA